MNLGLVTLVFFWVSGAQASTCALNQYKPEDTQDPSAHYKEWAIQKICMDDFNEPKKVSVEDDRLQVVVFAVKSVWETGLPSGGRVTQISGVTSAGTLGGEITLSIMRSTDRSPLALTAKTSEGFEFGTGL